MKLTKALQTHLFISLYRSLYTEKFQWHCYNKGTDCFSCSDCNALNNSTVGDRGSKLTYCNIIVTASFQKQTRALHLHSKKS